MPFALVGLRPIDDVGSGPILAPEIWAPEGGLYQRDTAGFPDALRQDIALHLAASGSWAKCIAGWTACAAPDLLRAYYDYSELGAADAGLAKLEALVPPEEQAWLRAQAHIVEQNLALPE